MGKLKRNLSVKCPPFDENIWLVCLKECSSHALFAERHRLALFPLCGWPMYMYPWTRSNHEWHC